MERMRRATEAFREHDPAAATVLLQTFLIIASHPDRTLTQADLAKAVNVKQASMSHNIARLATKPSSSGAVPRHGGEHLGLITIDIDPSDARRKTLRLTAAGRNLASEMGRILLGRGD